MATYYRLSKTGDSLPKHWAYLDDFDLDGTDNRNDGFQAWESLPRVIYAAFGYDCDGTYDANEYSTFLVIEADEDCVSDGVGEWWAIENEGVEKVYSVPTAKLVEFVEDGWNNDDE